MHAHNNSQCISQPCMIGFVTWPPFLYYRSLENFCLNLFRCNKISSKKFSWITYTHEIYFNDENIKHEASFVDSILSI